MHIWDHAYEGSPPHYCYWKWCINEYDKVRSLAGHIISCHTQLDWTYERFEVNIFKCYLLQKYTNMAEPTQLLHICKWKGCLCVTDDIEDFRYHIETHIYYKPFKCKWGECRRSFKRLTLLRDHMRRHRKDRELKCRIDGCEHASFTTSNRNQHERTHEKVLYKCDQPFCSAMFPRVDYLYNHLLKHEQFDPLIPCNFPMCKRKFISEEDRDDHINGHTNQTRKLTLLCPSP